MRVRPVRFTDDVAAMRRFLEAMGLRARITSDGGGWVDLTAAAGLVGLHDAASSATGTAAGVTTLSFESEEPLEILLDRLHAAGFADAHIVDEAYGRVLVVTDPDGVEVHVDEVMSDLYGYTEAAPTPASVADPTARPTAAADA